MPLEEEYSGVRGQALAPLRHMLLDTPPGVDSAHRSAPCRRLRHGRTDCCTLVPTCKRVFHPTARGAAHGGRKLRPHSPGAAHGRGDSGAVRLGGGRLRPPRRQQRVVSAACDTRQHVAVSLVVHESHVTPCSGFCSVNASSHMQGHARGAPEGSQGAGGGGVQRGETQPGPGSPCCVQAPPPLAGRDHNLSHGIPGFHMFASISWAMCAADFLQLWPQKVKHDLWCECFPSGQCGG